MNIKNKSIEILEKQKCTGCEACCQICPENAITMEYNNEGFLYPIVDHNKCTNCGLCSKICPEIGFTFDNSKNPKCYAMEAIDEIRKVSSSGGMFTILSNYVFEKGDMYAEFHLTMLGK
ncbi:4Fe-4S dicluster domain-containing protein [Brachyspira pulli]|uniref:4Fe-4S dicluster domain-containing protein n=1 Tax=Brachyspira pulli TaxID=310721 RepID=UPI00300749D3